MRVSAQVICTRIDLSSFAANLFGTRERERRRLLRKPALTDWPGIAKQGRLLRTARGRSGDAGGLPSTARAPTTRGNPGGAESPVLSAKRRKNLNQSFRRGRPCALEDCETSRHPHNCAAVHLLLLFNMGCAFLTKRVRSFVCLALNCSGMRDVEKSCVEKGCPRGIAHIVHSSVHFTTTTREQRMIRSQRTLSKYERGPHLSFFFSE